EVGSGSPRREPGIVDEDIDISGLLGKPPDLFRIAKVGGEETRRAAGTFNFLDALRSALRVASVHDPSEPVGGQLQGDRTTDTGRRPGHKRRRRKAVGHVLAPYQAVTRSCRRPRSGSRP